MFLSKISRAFVFLCLFVLVQSLQAQSLKHPAIWITEDERADVLEKISKYDWAKEIVKQLHDHVDNNLAIHQKNPNIILNKIPAFAKNDHENKEHIAGAIASKHNKVLALASNSAILYYINKEEKYAQFAADILAFYIDELAARTPETTTICGYEFFDPRTTYAPFAIAYDFIYNYLKKPGVKVFNKVKGKRITFNNDKAQKAIGNMVGNVLQEYGKPDVHGKTVSNHPILTAPGALFGILCIEDDVERERLFTVFWEKGTAHQNSFKHTILPMFSGQGVWPESLSYGFMPIITMVLNIVDRVKPEMNVTAENKHIFEGNFLFDYLRHPDRRFVRYGDSKRNKDGTGELYRYTMSIAKRRGYTTLLQKARVALSQSYAANGYKPSIEVREIFNNFSPLQLFWGHPIPKIKENTVNYNAPTVIVEHAGVALQRNSVESNNKKYGLSGIIGGAHYVHSHLTGITMELYGSGYVMAPNAGLPRTVSERKIPLHENYFRLYAGNNTVVVNGSSHGRDEGSWKGRAHVWQNKVVNIAAEPKHLQEPVSAKFSFATQLLNDEVNNAKQQRTLSVIRTSDKTGYYLDVFRSKSLNENKFHDYVYHNIGDEIRITDTTGDEVKLNTTQRFKNDIGDLMQSPGWRYFKDAKVTKPLIGAIKTSFKITHDNNYMHVFTPEGIERDYATALAPATREAKNNYDLKKTQVLVIRKKGEAWNLPFVNVLEPSARKKTSVQSVKHLMDGNKVVGAVVTSKIKKQLITDYIISQDTSEAIYYNKELNLKFEGRFGIIRVAALNDKIEYSLYIGDGKSLSFKKYRLDASIGNGAFKVFNK